MQGHACERLGWPFHGAVCAQAAAALEAGDDLADRLLADGYPYGATVQWGV